MLTLNKYLREIGYSEETFPFKKEDKNYYPDENNFVPAEFYSLDVTIAMEIYSRLCYFRENIADRVTPGMFLSDGGADEENKGHRKWLKTLDKIIYGYKLYAATEEKALEFLNRDYDTLDIEDYFIIKKEFDKSHKLLMKIYWALGW